MIVKENLDLTEYNSYKVHSVAALALFPESVDDSLADSYCSTRLADAEIIMKILTIKL